MSEHNFIQKHLSDYGSFDWRQGGSFDILCKEVADNKNVSLPQIHDWERAHTVCGDNFPWTRTAMGRKGGFEWWTSLFFRAQETQDLIQRCKSANMLFQKYVDLKHSYVLFKTRWPLVKWLWHQCKSSVCRGFGTTNWMTVHFPDVIVCIKWRCHWGNIGLLVA